MPLNITAALAVKKIMEREQLPGTLELWPGVAEELLGTKAYFVRAGVFKDVDVALFAHVGNEPRRRAGATAAATALVSVEYTFKGESAHAAGAPWRGRCALDAVELMDIGWNFRREHLRLQQRSHYVITNGGDQPNVVPPNASGLVLLPRDRLRAHQGAVGDRRHDGARRAAMMTDTEVDRRGCSARRGRSTSTRPSPRRCTRTSRRSGCRRGTRSRPDAGEGAAERAEGAGERAGDEARARCAAATIPNDEQRGGGSDDIGDVSWNVPTVTLRYPVNIPSLPGPQLGERDRDGDADRAQGRRRRREGRRR